MLKDRFIAVMCVSAIDVAVLCVATMFGLQLGSTAFYALVLPVVIGTRLFLLNALRGRELATSDNEGSTQTWTAPER